MKQHFINEKTGICYTLQGEYYLPCLTLPTEEKTTIGIWGRRHLRYIKEYKRLFYINLLTSGKLNSYLADINEHAQERFEVLIEQKKQVHGITEQLKSENAL